MHPIDNQKPVHLCPQNWVSQVNVGAALKQVKPKDCLNEQILSEAEILTAISASLENFQLSYEEMQTSLEASIVTEEELALLSKQIIAQRDRYYELFQFAPDAYLLTDANGSILEKN